jgi:hypothetical protein
VIGLKLSRILYPLLVWKKLIIWMDRQVSKLTGNIAYFGKFPERVTKSEKNLKNEKAALEETVKTV